MRSRGILVFRTKEVSVFFEISGEGGLNKRFLNSAKRGSCKGCRVF